MLVWPFQVVTLALPPSFSVNRSFRISSANILGCFIADHVRSTRKVIVFLTCHILPNTGSILPALTYNGSPPGLCEIWQKMTNYRKAPMFSDISSVHRREGVLLGEGYILSWSCLGGGGGEVPWPGDHTTRLCQIWGVPWSGGLPPLGLVQEKGGGGYSDQVILPSPSQLGLVQREGMGRRVPSPGVYFLNWTLFYLNYNEWLCVPQFQASSFETLH